MAKKVTISSELYKPAIRLIVALIILAVINAILTALPMIRGLVIPRVFISAAAIISVVIGIIMIAIFLNFRRDFVPRLQTALPAFPESGTIVSSGIILAVIVIAHLMFDGVILPLIRGFSWVYPVFFLLLAIAPLYSLILTLYRSSDKITNLITGKMAEVTEEATKCPQCGETNPSTVKFCSSCGADLESVRKAVQGATPLHCSKCGAENSPDAKFCQNCGASLLQS